MKRGGEGNFRRTERESTLWHLRMQKNDGPSQERIPGGQNVRNIKKNTRVGFLRKWAEKKNRQRKNTCCREKLPIMPQTVVDLGVRKLWKNPGKGHGGGKVPAS